MNYRELAAQIAEMNAEQLDMTVTVYVRGVDEFYSLATDYPMVEADADDVLDATHPYLVI